jgi:hypothetical protein
VLGELADGHIVDFTNGADESVIVVERAELKRAANPSNRRCNKPQLAAARGDKVVRPSYAQRVCWMDNTRVTPSLIALLDLGRD